MPVCENKIPERLRCIFNSSKLRFKRNSFIFQREPQVTSGCATGSALHVCQACFHLATEEFYPGFVVFCLLNFYKS